MKNESEIFESMQSGDWDSFNLFFEKYSEQLYTYAYAFVKNQQVAEDIIQDAFIYLWVNRKKIRWEGSIYGYLFRSVRNACLNYKVRCRVEAKYKNLAEAEHLQPTNNEESLEELHILAMRFISGLPEKCREIFIMGSIDGLSYAEIAQKAGISINTVKTQMRRAKNKLNMLSNGDKLMIIFF